MAILDDSGLPGRVGGLEIVRRLGRLQITHAVHDVDGTHSLIRDWMPVMSAILHCAITSGLPEDFDSEESRRRVVAQVEKEPLPETDRFCVESGGMSALSQMEWAIRRGIEEGTIRVSDRALSEEQNAVNSAIVGRMWEGEERFPDLRESPQVTDYIGEKAPRLFRFYEAVLNEARRDRNLAAAREDPRAWRVPGSLEFLEHLRRAGVSNYFVTGAVISDAETPRGMAEELLALGFGIGRGKVVEGIRGSSWEEKLPKDELIAGLLEELGVEGGRVLVVGDGRSEVRAGVGLGAAVMSRLPPEAGRQREVHRRLGTNYIVVDYTEPALLQLVRVE